PNRIEVPVRAEDTGRRLTIKTPRNEVSALMIPRRNLWRIGQSDHDYSEFAVARKYDAFPSTFPRDVSYHVGSSLPKRDWPFIHPGPSDLWAGGRPHPFRISFALPSRPAGNYELTIDLVDTQWRDNSPVLAVRF